MKWNAIFVFLLVFTSAGVTAQNLQLEYVTRLLAMVSGDTKAQFDYLSQPAALQNLRDEDYSLMLLLNEITFGSVPMRMLKYILCGTLVLSATAALAEERTFELPIREHIFENGLRLLVIERPRETRVVAKIFTDMGALNETPGQYGSAHFLEHLMFKGTPTLGARDWPREKEIHDPRRRSSAGTAGR